MSAKLLLLALAFAVTIGSVASPIGNPQNLLIALVGALPILVGSSRRWVILRRIDWHTLVFFAAMFVLMESVWRTGFFQELMHIWNVTIASTESILIVSVLLSQFISNVPLVALYQPALMHAGASTAELMALAAGSTIAGNLFILVYWVFLKLL